MKAKLIKAHISSVIHVSAGVPILLFESPLRGQWKRKDIEAENGPDVGISK